MGYEPEYEKDIDGLTPDWYLPPRGQGSAFIVEVFTDYASATGDSASNQLSDLYGRLGSIPHDVILDIKANQNELELTQHRNSVLSGKVQQWLTDCEPPVGAELTLDEITFKVHSLNTGRPRVRCFGPVSVFAVNNKPLRDRLREKVHRYENLNMPLVVAVIADHSTGYDLEELLNVVRGQEAVTCSFGDQEGVSDLRTTRLNDGLFPKAPALSTVLWLERTRPEWKTYVVDNPYAARPLPLSTWQII